MSDLLGRNRYVIAQKTKLIELTNEFAIRDEEGNQIGLIRQEGQSTAKKLARFVSSLDQFMTHTLAVYDSAGSKVLELTRPRKIVKSRLLVTDGTGTPAGQIVQQNVIGKIRFGLETRRGRPWARSPRRTGGRGTSRSRMPRGRRSPASRRRGRA